MNRYTYYIILFDKKKKSFRVWCSSKLIRKHDTKKIVESIVCYQYRMLTKSLCVRRLAFWKFVLKYVYHKNLHPLQLFTGCPSVILIVLGWFSSSSTSKLEWRCCWLIWNNANWSIIATNIISQSLNSK